MLKEIKDKEEWKPILIAPEYEASNQGRIRNGARKNILVQRIDRYGYLTVSLGRKHPNKRVHRLVLMAFNGQPEGLSGLHKDDNKKNNNLENLYWGTLSENQKDSVRNGKHNGGAPSNEKNGMSKFSQEVVNKIRNEYTGKWGEKVFLAKKYNMHETNVGLILREKRRAV